MPSYGACADHFSPGPITFISSHPTFTLIYNLPAPRRHWNISVCILLSQRDNSSETLNWTDLHQFLKVAQWLLHWQFTNSIVYSNICLDVVIIKSESRSLVLPLQGVNCGTLANSYNRWLLPLHEEIGMHIPSVQVVTAHDWKWTWIRSCEQNLGKYFWWSDCCVSLSDLVKKIPMNHVLNCHQLMFCIISGTHVWWVRVHE